MLPFAGGIGETLNGLMLLSAIAALLYALLLPQPVSWRRTAAKTLSTALLALIAFHAGGPWLLVIALVLCVLGDFFLAHDGPKPFLAGLVSFLAAHLVYVALFATHDPQALSALPVVLLPFWAALTVITVCSLWAGFMASILVPALEREMKAPVVAYMLAILAMVVTAALWQPVLAVIGAIAFLASDSMLAMARFVMDADDRRQRPAGLFVWLSYYAAKVMILLAML